MTKISYGSGNKPQENLSFRKKNFSMELLQPSRETIIHLCILLVIVVGLVRSAKVHKK